GLVDDIPVIKRSQAGHTQLKGIASRWLMGFQTRSSTASTDVVGRQGWADRRFSGMKTASLQGRIHGVSAQPCRPIAIRFSLAEHEELKVRRSAPATNPRPRAIKACRLASMSLPLRSG